MGQVHGEVKVIEEILNYLAIPLTRHRPLLFATNPPRHPRAGGTRSNERGDAKGNIEPIHLPVMLNVFQHPSKYYPRQTAQRCIPAFAGMTGFFEMQSREMWDWINLH